MNIIKKAWKTYCDWLDEMGLTPENKRCCVPLDERAQKALRGEQDAVLDGCSLGDAVLDSHKLLQTNHH